MTCIVLFIVALLVEDGVGIVLKRLMDMRRVRMVIKQVGSLNAANILRGMTEGQKKLLAERIAERKLLCSVFNRPFDEKLCKFVERRLV